MIAAQTLELFGDARLDLLDALQVLVHKFAILPVGQEELVDATRRQIGALRLHERMATEEGLADFWRHLVGLGEEVDEGVVVLVEYAIGVLLARECDLLELLAELDARPTIDLDELEDAAERRLLLTRDQVCADAEHVDGVTLLLLLLLINEVWRNYSIIRCVCDAYLRVERVKDVLVDVVAGHDGEMLDRVDFEVSGDLLEERAHLQRQIGQIARVQANAQRLIAELVQGQCYGTKIGYSTPVVLLLLLLL